MQDLDQKEYIERLKGIQVELPHLLDAVAEKERRFFEAVSSLEDRLDKSVHSLAASGMDKSGIGVWVIGCGPGEEAYTAGILLQENPDVGDFYVLGSDISENSLEVARRAVYPAEKTANVPLELKKKYFLKSKQQGESLVRVIPELRRRFSFRQINYARDFALREEMDIIICRDTLAYFQPPVQEVLIRKFCSFLTCGGFFLSGMHDDLSRMRVPLDRVGAGIYRRQEVDGQ